ncbi:MAG: DUF2851 family protein [bacterium]|nr:DUF2851 family protein [bacterium]
MLTQLERFASPYTEMLSVRGEVRCLEAPVCPSEAHLQALWNDDSLRPEFLTLTDGTPIVLLEKGLWNHGDGPDFKNALFAINGCLQRGDIEIHRQPRDWDTHQHHKNPDYNAVVLHVTWEETPPAKTLPSQIATLALKPLLEQKGAPFDFSKITFSTTRDASAPCQCLSTKPGVTDRLLTSAGYHRFLQKAKQFLEKTHRTAPFQVFYEGLLRAMGYQRNADAFMRLAQEVPFETLVDFPVKQRFAVLAGIAGLLQPEQRELWDLWWQSGCQPPLEPFKWDMRALRPQNHPYRRLAGGVGVLNAISHLFELSLHVLSDAIQEASMTLADDLQLKGMLIGTTRANALVNNLFIPYRLATGTLSPTLLNDLPGESISAPMREVWMHLTGTLKGLPKDSLRQQGLLQIYHDFCHNDHVFCATCPIFNQC